MLVDSWWVSGVVSLRWILVVSGLEGEQSDSELRYYHRGWWAFGESCSGSFVVLSYRVVLIGQF